MTQLDLKFSIKNHWIHEIKHDPSPNWRPRPDSFSLDLIVIHCISIPPGVYQTNYISLFFQNKLPYEHHEYFKTIQDHQVSAHLLIKRCGQMIQFVPFNLAAWHAGVSQWKGRENCNNFSIGIELEGLDSTAYTQAQYQSLIDVTKLLLQEYPTLSIQNIVGHSDIAPGRKSDPGKHFKWHDYLNRLQRGHEDD